MRTNLRRAVSAATMAIAVAAFPLALAGPAHATPAECQKWMRSQGYVVGEGVEQACRTGGGGSADHVRKCAAMLTKLDVPQEDANHACKHAAS